MSQNLIELVNVSFAYHGGQAVLKEINLEIKQNELLIIQGESGAGKSTFLKLLNRFCEVDSGEVFFNGKRIQEYKIDRLRASIIYFSQLPIVIDGTVKDNLSFPFDFHINSKKKFDQNKAREWLDYFQMDVSLTHEAMKLSVGQKQRIALVRSILQEPEILLLDEPCSSLDSNNKRLIEKKIEDLISSSGITIMLATHSDVSFDKSNYRVLCVEKGGVAECRVE